LCNALANGNFIPRPPPKDNPAILETAPIAPTAAPVDDTAVDGVGTAVDDLAVDVTSMSPLAIL
jgi:hypothetical protein